MVSNILKYVELSPRKRGVEKSGQAFPNVMKIFKLQF